MNDYAMKQFQSITLTSINRNDYQPGLCVQHHCLVYVVCGTMSIEQKGKTFTLHAGECVFGRKVLSVTLNRHPDKDSQCFKSITMNFTRPFLQNIYRNLPGNALAAHVHRSRKAFLFLPMSKELENVINALEPYFNKQDRPTEEWEQQQLSTALSCLLKADKSVYATIFDFAEPWKIDLLDFMNENYMYRLSLKELANYSGRSLSTFKRDFKKVTDLTPERWLIDKRLCEAQKLLSHGNKRIKEVMDKVGICNQSYFSRAYKEKFGYTPKHTPQEAE